MACYRRKSAILPGKLISSTKTPKNSVFLRTNMGITSLWEDLEAKLLTPGQLLGYHWMAIPKFWPKLIPRLFVWYQIFRNWNRDFFSGTIFSKIKNKTFFPRPNSPKLIPKPCKNWQKLRDRDWNWDFLISLTIFGEIFSKYFPPFPSQRSSLCFPPSK